MDENGAKKRDENSENWSNEDWQNYFAEVQKEEERKDHFRQIGKLGGRPKKDETLNTSIRVRLTSAEKKKAQNRADKLGVTLSEYCRKAIENKPFPDKERNLTLLEYRTNFQRISNFFKRDIWSDSERAEYLKELKSVIEQIKRNLG